MVDLQGQLEPIKSEVLNRFETILEEASFINGGAVSQFQKELETYLGHYLEAFYVVFEA